MVPINLIRNLGMKFSDTEQMNIAVDIHIARVLQKTGLCTASDDNETMAQKVKEYAQQQGRFAYELDLPLWATGKYFCKDSCPNCNSCPIGAACTKTPKIKMPNIVVRKCRSF